MRNKLSEIEAIVLAGGQGSRIAATLGLDRPKALAPISGVPVMNLILDGLVDAGISKITLCIGHLRHAITVAYKDGYKGLPIKFVEEESPLGTGGAAIGAIKQSDSELCLIVNGDTLVSYPIEKMQELLSDQVDAVSLVAKKQGSSLGGNVKLSKKMQIMEFTPTNTGAGHVYAGVTLLKSSETLQMPHEAVPFGFEPAVLQVFASQGRLVGYEVKNNWRDIGTPDSLLAAQLEIW